MYNTHFFFALPCRLPILCMALSTVSLMAFLLAVAWTAWPTAVLVMSFVAGFLLTSQFIIFGLHRLIKFVVWTVRVAWRAVVRGRSPPCPEAQLRPQGPVEQAEPRIEIPVPVPCPSSCYLYFSGAYTYQCVLEDPFEDPPGLVVPDSPPVKPPDNSTRIAEDEDPLETMPEEEPEEIRRKKAAQASALTLEMVGDLPFANVRPPENVLFVCKMNPVTRDEDLELIFSRFGTIMSCQVIRDKKTGDSLQYAFIEFDKREDAEQVRCIDGMTSGIEV